MIWSRYYDVKLLLLISIFVITSSFRSLIPFSRAVGSCKHNHHNKYVCKLAAKGTYTFHPDAPKRKVNNEPSDIDTTRAIKIQEGRVIHAGDYVVHRDFGVGKFLGTRSIQVSQFKQPFCAIIIKFRDGVISIFEQQQKEKEKLWLFKRAEEGRFILDSIVSPKQWEKRRNKAMDDARS